MNTYKKTLLGLAALVSSSAVSVASMLPNPLGENYAGVGIGYGWMNVSGISNPDGWQAGAGVNYNVVREPDYGVDLAAMYGYARMSSGGSRVSGHTLSTSAILFTDVGAAKPFVSADLGYTWVNARAFGLSMDDDSWQWGFTGGVEFAVAEGVILTPFVSWTRDQDAKDSMWSGGVSAHYWVNETTGVGLSYSMTEGPIRVHSILATVGFRF